MPEPEEIQTPAPAPDVLEDCTRHLPKRVALIWLERGSLLGSLLKAWGARSSNAASAVIAKPQSQRRSP